MKLTLAPKANNKDSVIGAVGAALGMTITWLLCDWLLDSTSPILVMSMGASAVLLFATPASPLAQPVPVMLMLPQLPFLIKLSVWVAGDATTGVR
ncbi:MAG: hypothetical protein EBV42_08040, partial [Actinobacteria bacterium]|nr:hypothetical protein [Actinomycetota bacterium]